MAKSFKELGRKAESLIEKGNEADREVRSCQSMVSAASSRVASAQRMLSAASETNEEGQPKGDVAHAAAALDVAQNQLAASQRALGAAMGRAAQIKREKSAHAMEIERHNQAERSNLEKLRALPSMAFGENSAALIEGMVQRHNEAERARIALLRSMGMDDSPNYVSEDSGGSGRVWRGGGLASLDINGQEQSIQGGGGGEGLGGDLSTPVGGGLGKLGDPNVFVIPGGGTGAEGDPSTFVIPNTEPAGGAAAAGSGQGSSPYSSVFRESPSADIDLVCAAMEQSAETAEAPFGSCGRPRTPNEVLADMKKSVRENWMNNFNADAWKGIVSEKMYKERLELYRKGVAIAAGQSVADALSDSDLEQLSRVQNKAYLMGCELSEADIRELYTSAKANGGNFVTPKIEYKADHVMQKQAIGLLRSEKYGVGAWKALETGDVDRSAELTAKKAMLTQMVSEMNSILGTNVFPSIDFYYREPTKDGISRGVYSRDDNKVHLNEYVLLQAGSYQLMQTVIHEMRHAYQHHAIANRSSSLVSEVTAATWEKNFAPGVYKRTKDGFSFEEYVRQPVEWDAKNFAGQLSDLLKITKIPEYMGSWRRRSNNE